MAESHMEKLRSAIKKFIKNVLLLVPYLNTKIKNYDWLVQVVQNCGFPPGHFYSPIPNLSEIESEAKAIFADKDLEEINLNTEQQVRLLEKIKIFYSDYPYKGNNYDNQRYRYEKSGAYYRYSDSVFLFGMIRNFKPKSIIEVGSGHSSAIMLDTDEFFFDSNIKFTFIEPNPDDRLMDVLRENDKSRCKIIKNKVQSVELDLFQQLGENDILFIDSTHVSKVGSDVNYLIFEVLPTLKSGVLIHFHDIFYPFELPQKWILKAKFFWNENYLLHAFLMNNEKYEIVAFNSYLQKIKTDWFKQEMPECLVEMEETGSIWLQKK